MASEEPIVSPLVGLKAVLHAAKHPYASVSGLLLGKAGSSDGGKTTQTEIVDAVPVSHAMTTTTLTMDVAVSWVRRGDCSRFTMLRGIYYQNEKVGGYATLNGLSIVGAYYMDDPVVGATGTDIAPFAKQLLLALVERNNAPVYMLTVPPFLYLLTFRIFRNDFHINDAFAPGNKQDAFEGSRALTPSLGVLPGQSAAHTLRRPIAPGARHRAARGTPRRAGRPCSPGRRGRRHRCPDALL